MSGTSENTRQKYAGFWIRVAASLIDTAIVLLFLMVIAVVLGFVIGFMSAVNGTEVSEERITLYLQIINILACVLYSAFFISSTWQASLGKRAVNIYISTKDGHRLSFVHAVLRWIMGTLPSTIGSLFWVYIVYCDSEMSQHTLYLKQVMANGVLLLSYVIQLGWILPIAFTEEKKGLHDMICGTRVYYGRKGEENE